MNLPADPSGIALVLGGGGSKGSYEIGAFEALERLSVRAGALYGVSVGALNAVLYLKGDLAAARELWDDLRITDLYTEESLPTLKRALDILNHPKKIAELLAKPAPVTVDVSPFEALLRREVPEEALRGCGIRFGLLTTKVNGLVRAERMLDSMAPGSLVDWLMASAAALPAFPLRTVAGEAYADGGFCDNVPVGMALRHGAKHVIAFDIGTRRCHEQYGARPDVTYIRASRPLGGLLDFCPERADFNRRLGMNDTLRAFGALRGFSFSFDPGDLRRRRTPAADFLRIVSLIEAGMQPSLAFMPNKNTHAPFTALLTEHMGVPGDEMDWLLAACELCAELAELSPLPVYTLTTLAEALREALPLARGEQAASGLAGSAGALFAKALPDKKLAVAALYSLLKKSGMDFPLASQAASSFPREFLCALTLYFLSGVTN